LLPSLAAGGAQRAGRSSRRRSPPARGPASATPPAPSLLADAGRQRAASIWPLVPAEACRRRRLVVISAGAGGARRVRLEAARADGAHPARSWRQAWKRSRGSHARPSPTRGDLEGERLQVRRILGRRTAAATAAALPLHASAAAAPSLSSVLPSPFPWPPASIQLACRPPADSSRGDNARSARRGSFSSSGVPWPAAVLLPASSRRPSLSGRGWLGASARGPHHVCEHRPPVCL
ncbi:unnamed protein product, partial [Urochloa humidicola]